MVFTKSRLPKHMLSTLGSALGATVLDTWNKNKLKDLCKGAKVCSFLVVCALPELLCHFLTFT